MHHHHPTNSSAASAVTVSAPTVLSSTATTNIAQRRRKKRPNYGTRTVEVRRGYNGFGFTISGQQPCRLSCIVANSPADQAGLRAGDFLISVNNLNVSKLPHETVVQLIGNSFGSIRMQIAENYYSDSSDDEYAALMFQQQQQQSSSMSALHTSVFNGISGGVGGLGGRAKPRYLHHKTKMHRLRNSPQKKRTALMQQQHRQQMQCSEFMPSTSSAAAAAAASAVKPIELQALRPLIEESICSNSNQLNCSKSTTVNSILTKPPLSSSDVANVSAMVRVPTAALEYRAIVGYLGTIEMPKQISHSSKLQTVRSCIRKLRQEKRQPTTVLMTILPDCLRLQAANGNILASYASERLNYVSSSSESENRFFGLVTSAVHTSQVDEEDYEHDDDDEQEHGDGNNQENLVGKSNIPMPGSFSSSNTGHISISNSCHVFVIDTKLCEHQAHITRANEFRIQCTKDPISNLCLEFPNNSEYVVNLIRSMYTMRILPPATRHTAAEDFANPAGMGGMGAAAAAHSPQPSNHSEISTTTSNSDSGIGFHNDCTNISDRILVVDFPGAHELRMRPASMRPMGIFNNFDAITDKRLTVRAMPDPKTCAAPGAATSMRPNLLANFNLIKSPASSLTTTRSCDDVLALVEHTPNDGDLNDSQLLMSHASMDDISLHSSVTTAMSEELHTFLHPSCIAAPGGGCNGDAIVTVRATNVNRKLPFRTAASAGTTASLTYSLLQDCRSGVLERNSRHSLHFPPSSTSSIPSKLSPQVFASVGVPFKSPNKPPPPPPASSKTRHSLQFPAIDSSIRTSSITSSPLASNFDMDNWKSLQDLNTTTTTNSTLTTVSQNKATSSAHAHTSEVVNSEPDLLRDPSNTPSTSSSETIPKDYFYGWDLLYRTIERNINKKSDALIALAHFILTKHYNFQCIGVGEDKTISEDETGSELLPEGWNDDNNRYALRYVFNGNQLFLLFGHKMEYGGLIIINLLNVNTKNVSNIGLGSDGLVKEEKTKKSPLINELIPTAKKIIERYRSELIEPVVEKVVVTKAVKTQTKTPTDSSLILERPYFHPLIPPYRRELRFFGFPDVGHGDLDPLGGYGSGNLFSFPTQRDLRILRNKPEARFNPYSPDQNYIPLNPDYDHLIPPTFGEQRNYYM